MGTSGVLYAIRLSVPLQQGVSTTHRNDQSVSSAAGAHWGSASPGKQGEIGPDREVCSTVEMSNRRVEHGSLKRQVHHSAGEQLDVVPRRHSYLKVSTQCSRKPVVCSDLVRSAKEVSLRSIRRYWEHAHIPVTVCALILELGAAGPSLDTA